MSGEIIYSPETMTYTLSNGTDRIKLPNWAHIVIKDEVEREIMPLNNKIEILSDALALARDENTKLRELVRDMWTCILTADKSDNAWDECPRCILWNGNNNHRCEFNRRMKELGVDA